MIHYELPEDNFVKLVIYDILGRVVTVLVDEFKNAGNHEVLFNAINLPSGIYVYRLQAGKYVDVKKMLLLR